ncbi:uncharacterized protein LOC110999448 [Pieris rapae]|uniref:uncharacterized protein LOC110999448 n=1 Tax=Pieris rapae TaxID=64459 RepID=UPI001E27AC54|nr:uncharacterized protein LOC110999448 [Pieris rapae]
MYRYIYALCCAILILSVTDPLEGKRTFGGGRHSYPKSGGLSGSGGSHSYPSSGGLSGGSHGYPSSGSRYPPSGGLSGGGSGYPSSGGSHSYPSSGGSHSHPSSGGSHTYPSSGGSHGYPAGKGLSGNSPSSGAGHTTNIHNHYHYSPPQQIRYTPVHGGAPVSYPVYRGSPPTYVYQYKDSGSKYGTLLAGLALLNLGTLAGGAYALSHSGHSSSSYKPQPGEVCKFGIKKDNGDYEETKIDCRLITSFIFEEEAKAKNGAVNTTITTTTTNVTTVNAPASVAPEVHVKPLYEMLPNGTLVPYNATDVTAGNATSDGSVNNTSSVTTITTTNTTVTSALDVKGKPVEVTPGMQCYVIRHTSTSNMKRSVPCRLLQSYADQSLKKNSASRTVPVFTIITVILSMLVIH